MKKITIKKRGSINAKTPDEWVNKRERTKRLTVDVPASLHGKLKIHAAELGESMSDIINRTLIDILK